MAQKWIKKIIGSADVPPSEIVENDRNFRLHSDFQKEALLGAIEDIGYIRSVTVNKRTGRLLDGHLRLRLALQTGQATIPVEYVDLSEEEELEALSTIDPLAALAETNRDKLAALLQEVQSKSPAVTEMLMKLAQQNQLTGNDVEASVALPPGKFEVIVQCEDEQHQREVFERLNQEGLTCRVLTF